MKTHKPEDRFGSVGVGISFRAIYTDLGICIPLLTSKKNPNTASASASSLWIASPAVAYSEFQ